MARWLQTRTREKKTSNFIKTWPSQQQLPCPAIPYSFPSIVWSMLDDGGQTVTEKATYSTFQPPSPSWHSERRKRIHHRCGSLPCVVYFHVHGGTTLRMAFSIVRLNIMDNYLNYVMDWLAGVRDVLDNLRKNSNLNDEKLVPKTCGFRSNIEMLLTFSKQRKYLSTQNNCTVAPNSGCKSVRENTPWDLIGTFWWVVQYTS